MLVAQPQKSDYVDKIQLKNQTHDNSHHPLATATHFINIDQIDSDLFELLSKSDIELTNLIDSYKTCFESYD